jgi:hypothetical protein
MCPLWMTSGVPARAIEAGRGAAIRHSALRLFKERLTAVVRYNGIRGYMEH